MILESLSEYFRTWGKALSQQDFVAGRFDFKKLKPPWLKAGHPQKKGLNIYRYPPYLPHAGSGNMGVKKCALCSAGIRRIHALSL
jgi:hypothetical protein